MENSLFGMVIQVINDTNCTWRINRNLSDFFCVANKLQNKAVEPCEWSNKNVDLASRQSILLFLEPQSNGNINCNNFILSKKRKFLKKKGSTFCVELMPVGNSELYTPVLVGRYKNVDTTLLKGRDGFVLKKYMSPRADRYILQICEENDQK